jgi:beta-lactamase regulating signal transducer with metallopeptidase domain
MTDSIQTIAQVASTTLISSIWQGIVLAAAIWLCLKFAPRINAGVRFILWSAVFAAIALLPLLSIVIRQNPISPSAPVIHSSGAAILLDSRWALGIAACWAIFAASRLLILARNAIGLSSLRKRSTPVLPTPALEAILKQTGRRQSALCVSTEIEQPCVIGFFSPRILIPGWLLDSATPAEIQQIVLHESAHLGRFDDWTNLVQKLAVAFFPLNPALLWIERRLCAEREVACDESVVRATNAPREYATCLTHLAEQRLSRRTMALSGALSLGAWERRSQLASRIESILCGKASLGPLKTRALTLSLMVATVTGALKLGTTAQLVSFASPVESQPLAQSYPGTTAGPHYQNVVFHPTAATAPGLNEPASVTPANQPKLRPVLKNSPHRAKPYADGVESLVIVTRWQNATGDQMTVVRQFVRISASSAAPQAGWFVVQL